MFRSLFKKVIILCSIYLFKLHVWCHQDISMVNHHASGDRERQCTKSKVVTSKICLCETSCFKSLANIFFTFLFTFKWCFNEVFKINSWQLFCVDFILLLINCCSSFTLDLSLTPDPASSLLNRLSRILSEWFLSQFESVLYKYFVQSIFTF